MLEQTIINGRVLLADGLADTSVHIADGIIVGLGSKGGQTIDAGGKYVLPGIVDLHGDAFERNIMPRPDVFFPIELALYESDRQLISNGITTAYHGLTVSWESGLRSIERTTEIYNAIRRCRTNFCCQTYVHLRWETFATEQVESIIELIGNESNPILAFNDHTTEFAQKKLTPEKKKQMAERSGLDLELYQHHFETVWQRRKQVPELIKYMAEQGQKAGAVLLAHDESSQDDRSWYRDIGVVASEFPINRETAEAARIQGEHVILGAPNVLRGRSHKKNLNATEAIVDDLCSVLASDYYYPSQLAAAFKLVEDGVCTWQAASSLIARNPAEVANLSDRGELTKGKRADIIIVNQNQGEHPQVTNTFVGGNQVFQKI